MSTLEHTARSVKRPEEERIKMQIFFYMYNRKTILASIASIIIFISIPNFAHCQVAKYRTTAAAINAKGPDNIWGKPTDWMESSILITVDAEKQRIVLYAREIETYDVVRTEGVVNNSDGSKGWSFFCVDQRGSPCRVRIVDFNNGIDSSVLQIRHDIVEIMYKIYSLD